MKRDILNISFLSTSTNVDPGNISINPDVSWEGHLWGAISGVVLAWHYRKYTIRRDKFDWEDEEDEESESEGEEGTGTGKEEGGGRVEEYEAEDSNHNNVLREGTSTEKQNSEIKRPNNISHTGEF